MNMSSRIAEACEASLDRPTAPFVMNPQSFLIVAFAATFLALPMLVYGPMPQSHDAYQHLNFIRNFTEQFWSGEWYPRWLMGINHGLGSPSLFVYPPLPSYVCALLEPVAKVFHFDAFRAGAFLALFGSGISAFVWLSTMAGRNAALFGAVLYMLMPYHLALDFYRRMALSECWAFVWMPFVLYFSIKAVREARGSVVGLGVSYALLILSHLPTVFLFSLIPIALVVSLSPRGQRLESCLRVGLGMLLGAGLSSFYLISALSHRKYFPAARMPPMHRLDHHLLNLQTLLHQGGMNHIVSLIVVSIVLPCAMCGALVFAKGSPESRREVIFWLTPCIISIWLMSTVGAWVWKVFPLLHASVLYPGRLNIILSVSSLAIVGAFLSQVPHLPSLSRTFWIILLLLGITPWLFSYWFVWHDYPGQVWAKLSVNEEDGLFLAWPAPGLDDASALRASTEARARFLPGTAGSANVLLWNPRKIEIQTNSQNGGVVVVNQFYYPPWKATLTDSDIDLEVKAAMPEGLVAFAIPPGVQDVRLEIPVGTAERTGQWISGLCLLLSIGISIGLRRKKVAAVPFLMD